MRPEFKDGQAQRIGFQIDTMLIDPSGISASIYARNILDISPDSLAHVARTAKKIAVAGMKAFNADGITLQQFSEHAGGQVVFHLHVHVMPRVEGVALLPPASRKEDVKVLEDHATRLIAALSS